MLRYQLNPHFLFNTLNAISTLVLDGQNRTANLAVSRLSEFLRYTLDQDPMKKVTLRQELDALNLYLGIEKLRFGDRLRLEFDVDERAESALVPSLLLQPLVENAMKYAIAPREQGGAVTVIAGIEGGGLRLAVVDDGPGLPPAVANANGRGVGLRNTRERLKVLYGDAHSVEVARRIAGPARRDAPAAGDLGAMGLTGPIRAIIVDDEPLARRGLELRLRDLKDFEIVAQCANGREAIEAVAAHAPDLMFLDIEMPGIDGFEVLRRVPQTSMPMVVFVTAFDRYAIDAFDAHALDYLLKPLVDERLERTLEHVREHFAQRNSVKHREQLVALLARVTGAGQLDADELIARGTAGMPRRFPEMLPIRLGRETVRLPVAAIEWVDAAGDYMCVHAEGRTHVVRATMKQFEERLDPADFQRIHRSTIVNVRRIRKLKPHTNGEYFLTLDGGHELKLSRSYRDRLERILGKE